MNETEEEEDLVLNIRTEKETENESSLATNEVANSLDPNGLNSNPTITNGEDTSNSDEDIDVVGTSSELLEGVGESADGNQSDSTNEIYMTPVSSIEMPQMESLMGIPEEEHLEEARSNVDVDESDNEEMADEDDESDEGIVNDIDDRFIDNEDEGIEIIQFIGNRNNLSDTDESESSEDEDAERKKRDTTFDLSLPNSHSYLGENMEELKGRTVHTEGEIVMMPLFFQPGVVLVPGQTLPLNLFHPQPISMMKKVIAADKTFGLMMSKGNRSSDQRNSFAGVGVTCEIYSVREDSVYGVDQMSLKGEGRQRFRILSKQFQIDGVIMGKILILPDAPIPPYPEMSLIYSQHKHNAISSQVMSHNYYVENKKWQFGEPRYMRGFNPKHRLVLCQSTASLPGWIYKLYNPYFLMDCLMNEISSWNSNLKVEDVPIDPTGFSHWITASLPLTNEMKIELIEIDSAVLRLRRQIELMSKCTTTLACNGCRTPITDKAELFCLSRKGPMAAYVNPGGHVHETVTFYKTKNLSLRGRSSTEYSWFPGYAWTIAECKKCRQHMGWKFTAAKKGLEPTKFWGLTRTGLKPVFKDSENEISSNEDEDERDMNEFSSVMYESNI